MKPDPQTTWIKRGLHRSVAIQSGVEGGPRVIKRYRARSWLRRFRDRGRARNEFEILRRLRALGLRVPEPLSLQHAEGAWELHCELIEGARRLIDVLEAPHGCGVVPETLARRFGRLVGRAHAHGLDHGDLHVGNLLVDVRGEAWMIDFTNSALHARLSPAVVARDLVNLAADTRETVALDLRRRFFIAWRREVALDAREIVELAARVERLAVARRRAALVEHEARWLRASGVCEPLDCDDVPVLLSRVAREACPTAVERLVELDRLDGDETPLPLPGTPFELWSDTRKRSLRTAWTLLGRASQHHLPGLIPLALFGGDRPRAVYLVPAGARPLAGRSPSPAALGRFHDGLFDRGLKLVGEEGLWIDENGELRLGPTCRLDITEAGLEELERRHSHG